jgi:ATP-dependent RNA helicase DeaD
VPAVEIAAALAKLARGDVPLLLDKKQQTQWEERPARQSFDRPERADRFADRGERPERSERFRKRNASCANPSRHATYRIEVGYQHGVKPGNIVGAIANEGGIDSKNIGRIEIYDDYAVLDMPDTLSREALDMMAGIRVAGQRSASASTARAHRRQRQRRPLPRAPKAAKPAGSPLEQVARAAAAEAVEEARPRRKRKSQARSRCRCRRSASKVGRNNEITPANIVGAIANETGLEAKYIGRIEIFDDHSMLELPDGMPEDMFRNWARSGSAARS